MINSVKELLDWMIKNNLDTEGVELTVHVPTEKVKYHFVYTIHREVSLVALNPKASVPNELNFFGIPVHVEVKL